MNSENRHTEFVTIMIAIIIIIITIIIIIIIIIFIEWEILGCCAIDFVEI